MQIKNTMAEVEFFFMDHSHVILELQNTGIYQKTVLYPARCVLTHR